MTGTKHREAIFQHWKSAIVRESRDLASLEQTGARALADPDVREDPTLESMIRSEVAERKAEFAQKNSPQETQVVSTTPVAAPTPLTDDAHIVFLKLKQEFEEAVKRTDPFTARELLARLKSLQAENPRAISTALEAFEEKITELAHRSRQQQQEIETVTAAAMDAAQRGDESRASQLLHRLTAIHAAQPALLDEARLDQIRRDVALAGQEDVHRKAAQKILERERAVATELTKLAQAVHSLRKALRSAPPERMSTAREDPAYRRVAHQVEEHGPSWLAGIILELGDLLAEWEHPPHDAELQVDRFVDGVRKGIKQIRAELQQIENDGTTVPKRS